MTSNLAERFDTVVAVMTEDEARLCVGRINAHLNGARVELLRLYEGRGWEALGYASWRACVVAEFGGQERELYRALQAAQVEQNIQSVLTNLSKPTPPESHLLYLARLAPIEQPAAYQRAVETAPNGKVTATWVASVVEEFRAPPRIDPLFDPTPRPGDYWVDDEDDAALPFDEASAPPPADTEPTNSDNWYTPPWLIDAARAVLGRIDLDPASCDAAQETVRAATHYTEVIDGLAHEWYGCVWLNPPYSEPLPWIQRLIDTHTAGDVEAAIVLVNTVNTPQWARMLWRADYPICLLNKRVGFWRPSGATKGGDRDQMVVLVCRSDDTERRDLFCQVFGGYGAIR